MFAFDGMEEAETNNPDVNDEVIENVSKTEEVDNIDIEAVTRVTENADATKDDSNISTVASESVLWLAQRLGKTSCFTEYPKKYPCV